MYVMKSPEQMIYDTVYKISEALGYDTFSYLPPEKVSYPFVFVGESFLIDRHIKRGLFGNVTQTVHVYNGYKNRLEVTTILNQIKRECYLLREAEHYFIYLKRGDTNILLDDTTEEHLLHGILELEFTFNYKVKG